MKKQDARPVIRLELLRSDMGDGGWSLHAHRTDVTDDDDSVAWPIVASGESETDDAGDWVRPLPADYEAAQEQAAALALRYPLEEETSAKR